MNNVMPGEFIAVEENSKVLAPFDFEADRWQLGTAEAIVWTHIPDTPGVGAGDEDPEFAAAFARLMVPVRRLVKTLALLEGISASRQHRSCLHLCEFAAWLLRQTPRRERFAEVSRRDVERYCVYLKTRAHKYKAGSVLSPRSLRQHFESLQLLYDHREAIEDGLVLPPFGALSPRSVAGGRADRGAKCYRPIPDVEHHLLFRSAYDCIRTDGPRIISRLQHFLKATGPESDAKSSAEHEQVGHDRKAQLIAALDRFARRHVLRVAPGTMLTRAALAAEVGSMDRAAVSRLLNQDCQLKGRFDAVQLICGFPGGADKWSESDLDAELILLQAACYTIIASTTGMRDSEIRAVKPGCLRRRADSESGTIYWITSVLDKARENQSCEWLCGEMAARAIEALEQLHACCPSTLETERTRVPLRDSLFRVYTYYDTTLVARPAGPESLRRWINHFTKARQLTIARIHPHQFRRSFARNVARWTTVPLDALRRHYKHWSILMTEHYVGIDGELLEFYYQEQRECSEEHIYRLLSGEAAGPGGTRYEKDLQQRIERGEIPKQYLGTVYEEHRWKAAKELAHLGFVVHPCGEYTHCAYPADGLFEGAKCGGVNHPIPRRCHPTACIHSHIFVEDVPFYLSAIIFNWRALRELDIPSRSGPEGGSLRKKLRRDYLAVAKLLPDYFIAARGMRERFDRLSGREQMSDFGMALKRRIERDSSALEIVEAIEKGGLDESAD